MRSGSGLSAEQSSSASSKRGRRRSIVSGKNGHKWFTTPRERVTNRAPFGSFIPGPVGIAKEAKTAYETWNLFFDDVILSKILQHTNEEIHRYTEEREIDCTKDILYKPVDMIELKAFIGLMYFSGLQKTNMTSSDDLWDTKYGSIFYKATMSQKRFCTILRFLRYDDKATRPTRVVNDKFAAIRGIWEIFIEKCKTLYNPASYCTIDEQLLSFRGRCPFKVYNGSKPDKYGMKIVMLNDSRTFYMVNAIPYVGKVNTENEEKVPSYYIRKLSETLLGTNRNITCDNWFSSIEIFDKMLEHNITMVGTLRKNKKEIPPDFKKSGQPGSSRFAFDGTKVLVSFTPKKNKVVLVLSTFHRLKEINESTGKPEMICFYNMTKGGTDTFDQLCHEYTTARKTRRWPMRVFTGMLDQAGINAMVIYNFNSRNEAMNRRDFLKSLIESLTVPQLKRRLEVPTMPRNVLWCIENVLKETVRPKPPPEMGKRARCALCPRSVDKKYSVRCHRCKAPMCESHRHVMCDICVLRDA